MLDIIDLNVDRIVSIVAYDVVVLVVVAIGRIVVGYFFDETVVVVFVCDMSAAMEVMEVLCNDKNGYVDLIHYNRYF